MGRHAYYLNPEQRVRATKINFILNPFGIMAYSLPNISVAIFINRILSLRGWRKWGIYGIAIAQSFIAGISCILLFAQCSPAKFLWDPTIPAKCLPSTVITGYSYFVGCKSSKLSNHYMPLLTRNNGSLFCVYRYRPRSCASCDLLETADETQNQGWSKPPHGHDCSVSPPFMIIVSLC